MKKILRFYSKVCAPCRLMSKRLEELDNVEVISIDINDTTNNELIKKYKVRSVPTIIVLDKDENPANEFIGVTTIDKLKKAVNNE